MYAVSELEALAEELPALIAAQKAALEVNAHQMKSLEKEGLIYANEYWRDSKYLYLIYPTDGSGQRKRKYVGCHPERIQTALDGIQRSKDYDRLSAETRTIENRLIQGKARLREAVHCLSLVNQW